MNDDRGPDFARRLPIAVSFLLSGFGKRVRPVVAGRLIGWRWDNAQLFVAAAVPALPSCLMPEALSLSRTARPVSDMVDKSTIVSGRSSPESIR